MKVTLNWLKEFVEIDLSAKDLASRLTYAGLEVEGIQEVGNFPETVVVVKILKIEKHPGADRLALCEVSLGEEIRTIVCGAKNMKEGDLVPLALPGTVLPDGKKIEAGKIRGVVSAGMLCSETELGLAETASGLLILPQNLRPGIALKKQLPLSDVVFEINVTPNRADCLSILGIAREIAALTGKTLKKNNPKFPVADFSSESRIQIELKDDTCPLYIGRVLLDVTVAASPLWVQKRLEWVGLRSINNIVDASNYVLIERGQPLHVFDLDKIEGGKICVQKWNPSLGKITSLDGSIPELTQKDLVICDSSKPLAIAGIMGGQNSGVSEQSKNLLLEAAYFDPATLRSSSKRLSLASESSYRFERGVDPASVAAASERLVELILAWAGGKASAQALEKRSKNYASRKVSLRKERLDKILGVEIPAESIVSILNALEFSPCKISSQVWECEIPSYRQDLEREVDLIEEIARLYGYDKIPETLPVSGYKAGRDYMSSPRLTAAKNFLVAQGFSELIHYSFISHQEIQKSAVECSNILSLQNPISDELSTLRPSLIPSLLASAKKNFSFSNSDLRFFELRKIYQKNSQGEVEERLSLALLVSGNKREAHWRGSRQKMDFYDLKGFVEALWTSLALPAFTLETSRRGSFHPGKSAELFVKGQMFGVFGELHPQVAEAFSLNEAVSLAELDFEKMLGFPIASVGFKKLSRFPGIGRDLTLQAPLELRSDKLLETMDQIKIEYLKEANLVSYFDKAPIPEGKKALTYHLYYQNEERTLTDEEVNEIHNKAVRKLLALLPLEWR
ncbi:MAG: phenylalanine--tRNA ligase subunit beta [Deltaproteobacteria bacterium]|nr:phenylalanine--tRNA ligase subunit beta [Deltaproteobacteria bacterium]